MFNDIHSVGKLPNRRNHGLLSQIGPELSSTVYVVRKKTLLDTVRRALILHALLTIYSILRHGANHLAKPHPLLLGPDSLISSKTRPLCLNRRPSPIPILHKALHLSTSLRSPSPCSAQGSNPYCVDYNHVCPKCSNQRRAQNQSIKLFVYG